jgi:serine/threonine protein phosphatase 1
MTTWLVGDVHGCARELARLIERLGPGRDDRIVLLGDLFHRGPDPFGVLELVQEHGLEFLLGNHEVALLQRLGWGVDDPHGLEVPEGLDAARVAGDGGRELRLAATRRAELVRFVVREHAGLFVEGDELPGGLRWCAVHAGVTPGCTARASRTEDLVWPARVGGERSPWWFERHVGPECVVFGHRVERRARRVIHEGRTVAMGIDTGCLFGGWLTAYDPWENRVVAVEAAASYVRRS